MPRKPGLKLTIYVKYDAHGVPVTDLKDMLGDIAVLASNRGLFTGDTEAEVNDWSFRVDEI